MTKEDEIRAKLESLDIFRNLEESLKIVDTHLARIFTRELGISEKGEWKPARQYLRLFELVSSMSKSMKTMINNVNQICADESTMQSLNRTSIKSLEEFVHNPSRENAQRMTVIPTIFHVLEKEYWLKHSYGEDVKGLCRWMLQRGSDTLARVLRGNQDALPSCNVETKDWERVSTSFAIGSLADDFVPRLGAVTQCLRYDYALNILIFHLMVRLMLIKSKQIVGNTMRLTPRNVKPVVSWHAGAHTAFVMDFISYPLGRGGMMCSLR